MRTNSRFPARGGLLRPRWAQNGPNAPEGPPRQYDDGIRRIDANDKIRRVRDVDVGFTRGQARQPARETLLPRVLQIGKAFGLQELAEVPETGTDGAPLEGQPEPGRLGRRLRVGRPRHETEESRCPRQAEATEERPSSHRASPPRVPSSSRATSPASDPTTCCP